MLKKIVSLAVGTACLFSMVGVSAMTVQTTTEYRASDIKVTTTVEDASLSGTTLTYLAHDGEITSGSNIVYVDQIIADATSETFEYVTQYNKIGSTVKVGGRNSAGAALGVDENAIPGVPVYLDEATDPISATFTTAGAEAGLVKVQVAELTGFVVKGLATEDGVVDAESYFVGNDGIWINNTVLKNSEWLRIDTGSDAAIGMTVALGYSPDDLETTEETDPYIIAVGLAKGNVKEYGILFGASADEVAAKGEAFDPANPADTNTFRALGKGTDGMYAVQLYNFADFVNGSDVYAAAYYIDSKDNVVIGDAINVTANGTDKASYIVGYTSTASLGSVEEEEVVEEEAIIFDIIEEDDVIDFIEIDEVIEVEEIEEVDVVDVVE